jgi:hypothetical protein
MAKEPNELKWIDESLPNFFIRKHMFGGFAYYVDERLMLLLFESTGNFKYKNKKYDFELWNGCMFPVEKDKQPQVKEKYDFLISHPILPKWLYLPLDTENFESHVELILAELKRRSLFFGTIPKSKSKVSRKTKTEKLLRVDTRKPRMFNNEEPAEEKLKSAKSIAELKNLGPATEKQFHKAGIKTVAQFQKLGWKKTLATLVKSNPKLRHSVYTYALIGALENKVWHKLPEDVKIEAREFTNSLKPKNKKVKSD